MDRGRVLDLIKGYSLGPNMRRLIQTFWGKAALVCREQGNYREPFRDHWGVTQGGLLFPTMFNILVDTVVRAWLTQTVGQAVTDDWHTQVRHQLCAVFYMDDAFLVSRDPDFLQEFLETLVGLLEWIGLRTNTKKTRR